MPTDKAAREDENWDLESIYDEKISPLMVQIIAISREHKIPMFASFAYSNDDENGHGFCTTHLHYDGRRPEPLARANAAVRSRHDFAAFAIAGKEAYRADFFKRGGK